MTPRVLFARVAGLFRRDRRESQLREEIQAHLDALADDYVRAGLPRPEAEAKARRDFGGIEQVKEAYRDQRGWPIVDTVRQDVRFARRLFVAHRGFTAIAVVALAMGMGVSMAFFTIVNAICFRGLPIDRPDRVLSLTTRTANASPAGLSYQDLKDLRLGAQSFAGLAGYSSAAMTIADEMAPERVQGSYISAGAFALLGKAPVIGREFVGTDDVAGAPPVAILGRAVWMTRYGGDPSVVGRTIRVNGTLSTVVGVMPDRFRFPGNADLWLPLARMPGIAAQPRDTRSLSVFGRLTDAATPNQAQGEVDAIASRLNRERATSDTPEIRLLSVPINYQFNGDAMSPVWLAFMTAGTLVLLVACANVANVLLMRAAARSREMAVRVSMGATRFRIVRQLLVESSLLATMSGVLGLALSVLGVRVLASTVPQTSPLPYWIEFVVDARVLVALVIACVASVFLFGLVPALHVSKVNVSELLQDGGRQGTPSARTRWWTAGFLAAEFALTIVLLANAAFGLQLFHSVDRQGTPIDPAPLLTASVTLPRDTYPTADQRRTFYAQLADRLDHVAGIVSATTASQVPPRGALPRLLHVAGRSLSTGEEPPTVDTFVVGPRYFQTIGVAMARGREFIDTDGTAGHENAIVNQRFADAYFLSGDALGQRIHVVTKDAPAGPPAWTTIVGVSPDVGRKPQTAPAVYLPDGASPPVSAVLLLRIATPASVIVPILRQEVARLDGNLPLYRVMPMEQAISESNWNGRVSAMMVNVISSIAFLLALVGLYAVTAHSVVQRTQEIGIRVALGAKPRDVAWIVLRRAAGQVSLGLVAGVGCTYVFARLFTDPTAPEQLTDLRAFVPVVTIVVLVSLAACVVPARRAARLDPIMALRGE